MKLHTVHYRLTQSLSTKIEQGIFFSCDLSAQGLNKIFLALQKSRQNLPCFFLREGWQKLGSTKHNRPNVFAYNPVSSMGHKITAWSVKINSFLFWFLEPISVIPQEIMENNVKTMYTTGVLRVGKVCSNAGNCKQYQHSYSVAKYHSNRQKLKTTNLIVKGYWYWYDIGIVFFFEFLKFELKISDLWCRKTICSVMETIFFINFRLTAHTKRK